MNKNLILALTCLTILSSSVAGFFIAYQPFNSSEKENLTSRLENSNREAANLLQKMHNKIKNHKQKNNLKKLLNNLIYLENHEKANEIFLQLNYSNLKNVKQRIENLKQRIKKHISDHDAQDIFQQMKKFGLLIKNIRKKVDELNHKKEISGQKLQKLQKKFSKKVDGFGSEKLLPLRLFVNCVNENILRKNTEEDAEIKMKNLKNIRCKDLLKNEKLKNMKSESEDFLNLAIEMNKWNSFEKEYFNDFMKGIDEYIIAI